MDPTTSVCEGKPHPSLGAVVHADHCRVYIQAWIVQEQLVGQSSLFIFSPHTASRAGVNHETQRLAALWTR